MSAVAVMAVFPTRTPRGNPNLDRQNYSTAREQPNAFTIEALSVCGEVSKITDGRNCGPGAVIALLHSIGLHEILQNQRRDIRRPVADTPQERIRRGCRSDSS